MRVVALGDSVVWGQSLENGEKFASILYQHANGRSWTADTTAELSDLRARSGATIDIGNDASTHPAGVSTKLERHEVPWSAPGVWKQIDDFPTDDARGVDAVILDGGANDFGISGRLFTVEVFSKEFGPKPEVDAEFRRVFREDFSRLLHQALRKFPNALIAVTGYYPILSHKSRLARLKMYWILMQIASAVTQQSFPLSFGFSALAVKRAKRNALYFHRQQLGWLRTVVTDVASRTGRRIIFVHPGFREHNAIAAWRRSEDQFIFEPRNPQNQPQWIRDIRTAIARGDWTLALSLVTELEPQPGSHPAAAARRRGCDRVHAVSSFEDFGRNLTCRIASLGHPTAAGAKRYGDRLVRKYEESITVSLRKHLGPLRQRSAPFSVRSALERYRLPVDRGLWFAAQLVWVDCLRVRISTRREFGAGTDDQVFLRLGRRREWLLNENIFQLDFHNDFEAGATDSFVIDPFLDGQRMHVGEIEEVTLRTHALADPMGAWRPRAIELEVNGLTVLRSSIDQVVRPAQPWTADPPYPAPA